MKKLIFVLFFNFATFHATANNGVDTKNTHKELLSSSNVPVNLGCLMFRSAHGALVGAAISIPGIIKVTQMNPDEPINSFKKATLANKAAVQTSYAIYYTVLGGNVGFFSCFFAGE